MTTPYLISYILLWVLVAGLFAGLLALYHHFGEMYLSSPKGRSEQGPDEGSLLKPMQATAVDGTAVVYPVDRPTLLMFVSTTCDVCKGVRAALPEVVAAHPDVAFAVVCAGQPAMVKAWAADVAGLVPVIADPRSKLSQAYNVDLTPFAIAVGADGLVRARGLANTKDGLDVAAQEAKALPIAADDDGHSHAGHSHDHSAEQIKEAAQ
jgi:hypothetical protein